jgi:hypothetical protein
MSNEYYVWDTEVQAQAALDYINGSGWFPIVGVNAATGEPQPDKQQTTSWASEVLERVDNKWCFPRIPEARLDAIGVPANDRQAFLDAFNPSIEEYDSNWFPTPEEDL